jgi:hypothetical protein
MEGIGNIAIERVRESIKSTIDWMDAHYMYAGPNGAKITNHKDLKKAMLPEDWKVYCLLNRLECEL